jgi:tagatose-6-phosphate ketose/aldose isomerase
MTSEVVPGSITHAEIFQQPEIWPDTLERMGRFLERDNPFERDTHSIVTGAGTSAYAALAIEAGLPGAVAVPTTDLLIDIPTHVSGEGVLLSIARSGDSPESVGVINRVKRLLPKIRHVAITCNAEGHVARSAGVISIILDPRTNDRSVAMTSSFSNMVLAGLCVRNSRQVADQLPQICARTKNHLVALHTKAEAIASGNVSRVTVLSSTPLKGWAQEAGLKILEMTGGRIALLSETYLGLRHGPISFLRADTLVLCLLSSDPRRRRYEDDLLAELRAKKLGRIIGITPEGAPHKLCDETVPAMAPELPDNLRTPFEIVFPQLLAYHLSLRAGLNPDNPSPGGVINRVVQGVRVYEE